MSNRDEDLMNHIKEELLKHGTLSILFYKMGDDYIVHKWGEFKRLSEIHKKKFAEYKLAGFEKEANSLTLMELPKDADVIYRILACGSLVSELNKLGIQLN